MKIMNMIKTISIILFSLMFAFVVGCKTSDKKVAGNSGAIKNARDSESVESKKKGKWEWEITPQAEQAEEKKKPTQKEFVYPLKTAETEPSTVGIPEDKKIDITFNFQNADIKEVLNAILGEILEINYTLDKRITGQITLRTTGKFYKEEMLNIIQAMLNTNGFALVKGKNIFQVVPIQEARSESKVKNISKIKTSNKEVITQIVPCRHVAPQAIIPTLRGLLTKAGFVIAPNDTHAIIISEKASNIDRLLKVIETFDVPFFAGKAMRFYEIKHANAKALAKDLELVVQTLGAKTKGPKMDIAFIPFQDTNKILVATNMPEIFSSVEAWISNIDEGTREYAPRLYVYKMQHEQAEATVTVLTELFKEKITPTSKPGEAAGKVSETAMKIIADKNTNSIIIKALPADYQNIKAIIETLDATPQQVLIEAIIAEVTLSDALAHGVEYFFRNKGRIDEGGSISLLPADVLKLPGIGGTTGPLTGFGTKAFSFNRDFDVIITLVAAESELEILSSPHLLVRDEQTASIQVGSSQPILTTQQQSTEGGVLGSTLVNQIQYRDIGTILTITPRIGENEMVTLDIKQELSAIAPPEDSSQVDSPAFTQRVTETSLVIKSGHVIYLGGIINIENELIIKKVPLLGDIPFLGNAFKSSRKVKSKTELMVLITPHVINTATEADVLTKEFKEKLKQIAKMKKKEIKTLIK
jgi:type II secretion system protein D